MPDGKFQFRVEFAVHVPEIVSLRVKMFSPTYTDEFCEGLVKVILVGVGEGVGVKLDVGEGVGVVLSEPLIVDLMDELVSEQPMLKIKTAKVKKK